MPQLSGDKLNEAVELTIKWYNETRARLIDELSKGHPYGTIKIDPEEQYTKFIQMEGPDWTNLIARLNQRYRGRPDAQQRVNRDLAEYTRRMTMYGQERQLQ